MALPLLAVLFGLALLVWSADRFVEGSAATARHYGMPPLLIGMVIVGFGTSAPEMVVSALAASQGNPGIALGNAYGSNITNIALILGLTALISPIAVHSQVLRKELPVLTAVTVLAAWQLWDGEISRLDAGVLLALFAGLMGWTIRQGLRGRSDTLGGEIELEMEVRALPLKRALLWLLVGLALLIVSSRILVWGAVAIAQGFGVSDLVIGLTVVAIGTSLPELASSLAATRKGEHHRLESLQHPGRGGDRRGDPSDGGGGGGDPSRSGGDGGADPLAVRVRLRIQGPGTHQPVRGECAAGGLCGVYRLSDLHRVRAGVGVPCARFMPRSRPTGGLLARSGAASRTLRFAGRVRLAAPSETARLPV